MNTVSSRLPVPKSYARTAIKLGSLSGLSFGILFSLAFASLEHLSFREILPVGLFAGSFFGLFFGLTMAIYVKGESVVFAVVDKEEFVSRLNAAMSQVAYNPATHTDDFFTYKPSFRAGLLAGRISIQLRDGWAEVVGPKVHVKKLLKRLATE